MAVLRPCHAVGCPSLVTSGYCPRHEHKQLDYDKRRGNSTKRGYDSRWQRFRAAFLAEADNAMCRRCKIAPASEIHHKLPLALYPHLKYDRGNLTPLCKSCHSHITASGSQ